MTPLLQLLNNATATGPWMAWRGGRGSIGVSGTFNGATVSLEARFTQGNVSAPLGAAVNFTAPGWAGFELPQGIELRAVVTGGTPSGLSAVALYGGRI